MTIRPYKTCKLPQSWIKQLMMLSFLYYSFTFNIFCPSNCTYLIICICTNQLIDSIINHLNYQILVHLLFMGAISIDFRKTILYPFSPLGNSKQIVHLLSSYCLKQKYMHGEKKWNLVISFLGNFVLEGNICNFKGKCII